MSILKLREKNEIFIKKIIFRYAVDSRSIIETIDRAYNKENSLGIERDYSLQNIINKSYFYVCNHEADALTIINADRLIFLNLGSRLKKIRNSEIKKDDFSLIEFEFPEKGYKAGIHICGYISEDKLIKNPKDLPFGSGLEQLAVLYASELNSEVDYNLHKELLYSFYEKNMKKTDIKINANLLYLLNSSKNTSKKHSFSF